VIKNSEQGNYGDAEWDAVAALKEPDDQLSPVDGIPAVKFPQDYDREPDAGELEAATTQAAVRTEHRRLLSEPSANVGRDDRPHFMRTVEGKGDVCGQDGESWPCPEWEHGETARAAEALGVSVETFLAARPAQDAAPSGGQYRPSAEWIERAARVAGVPVEEFVKALDREG
jgi:hypothetical protein